MNGPIFAFPVAPRGPARACAAPSRIAAPPPGKCASRPRRAERRDTRVLHHMTSSALRACAPSAVCSDLTDGPLRAQAITQHRSCALAHAHRAACAGASTHGRDGTREPTPLPPSSPSCFENTARRPLSPRSALTRAGPLRNYPQIAHGDKLHGSPPISACLDCLSREVRTSRPPQRMGRGAR